jgi:thiol:disulfide interchange protein DsbC
MRLWKAFFATVLLLGLAPATADAQPAGADIDWQGLPFELALTMKRGDGRRRIAVFSDPNCPFCLRFESDLAALDDITVHIFMYPVIRPESVRQTKAVWCSRDRVAAWTELMLWRIEPEAKPDCANPIEQLVALGRKLGARMTPTWFLPDGVRRSGAMRMADLVPLLEATAFDAGQAWREPAK